MLFGLAFPPFDMWFTAILAPIPLIIAAIRADRATRTAAGVWVGTMPLWAFNHQYVWAMSEAGIFPLVMYLAAFPALFVWMLARTHARWPGLPVMIVAPVLWTGVEVLRGEVVFDGYAQYLIGHPFIDRAAAMIGPIVGVYGVGLLVSAAAAAGVSSRFMREHGAPIRGMVTVLLGLAMFIAVATPRSREGMTPSSEGAFRIAAIQTNVPQDNRARLSMEEKLRDFREFCGLTREAAGQSPPPDLIVWPETMFPGLALNAGAVRAEREAGLAYRDGTPTTVFHDAIIELQREIGIPMLVGALAAEGLRIGFDQEGRVEVEQEAHFNSAFMIRDGVVEDARYDKMQLMPFGEVMPYISRWEWLERRLLAIGGRGLTFDLDAGKTARVFEIERRHRSGSAGAAEERLKLVAPICFETTFERQMRRLVRSDPDVDLIVNLSNDGWFAWFDAGREHFIQQCRWRSLELGLPMLRAANTGISTVIHRGGLADPHSPPGPRARTSGFVAGTFDVLPPVRTIYARFGNVVGWLCLAGSLALAAGACLTSRRRSLAAGDSSASVSSG